MSPFEMFRTKRQERINHKVERTAVRVSRLIQQDIEADKPGPFVRGIGESPLSMTPEAYVNQVRIKLSEELGYLGISNAVTYDRINTYIACSESSTLSFDSWPKETSPHLKIAYVRTSS